MNTFYIAASIAIVAAVTWLTRGLPYLLFGGKRKLGHTVEYLGKVLPASIMIILVVYCLKDISIAPPNFGLAEIISVLAVIGIHLWRKNTFLSISVGTIFYMVLIRTAFAF